MKENYEITDAELEIMQILWRDGEDTLNELVEKLSVKEPKNRNTIKTLLHRLIEKGAVESKKVNTREAIYVPKISEKKFLTKESNSFLKKLFHGSTEKLLLNFVEDKKISKTELKKLVDMLEDDD